MTATDHQRASSGSPYECTVGFSRAVRVGDRVIVSGTAPVWPDGSCPPDVKVHAPLLRDHRRRPRRGRRR